MKVNTLHGTLFRQEQKKASHKHIRGAVSQIDDRRRSPYEDTAF